MEMYPLVNVWRDVQVLASESSVALVTRQVPETEKHPAVRLIPLPAVVVPRPRVRDPKDAFAEKRLVDEAVVEKKLVEVAFVSVTLPVKVLVPE